MCLWMYSETKQTKVLEFEAEKGLFQGQPRRMGDLLKNPEFPNGFGGDVLSQFWFLCF